MILFSHGEFSYAFVRELETTNHGETVMVVQQRSRLGPEGHYIARSLPPASPEYDSEMLARIRTRLEEEVRLAVYLEHPNIAHVLGRAESQGHLKARPSRTWAAASSLGEHPISTWASGACSR